MIKPKEPSNIVIHKGKRVIKFRRDTEGRMVLPYHLFFEDIDYDKTEFVEDEDAEPVDWTKQLDKYKSEEPEPTEEEQEATLQAILSRREALDEEYELCALPAGTVIVMESEYREDQSPNEDGTHSKVRPLAISPRGKLKGNIALLQITSSPPRSDNDIEYKNIVKGCGLKHPSTVRCADVLPLPPNFTIYEDEIKGTLTKDSDTWNRIVEKCREIPDSAIIPYGPYINESAKLNCSIRCDDDVIAYVVMPNY